MVRVRAGVGALRWEEALKVMGLPGMAKAPVEVGVRDTVEVLDVMKGQVRVEVLGDLTVPDRLEALERPDKVKAPDKDDVPHLLKVLTVPDEY